MKNVEVQRSANLAERRKLGASGAEIAPAARECLLHFATPLMKRAATSRDLRRNSRQPVF
jgi:hypothetical protein